MAQDTTDDADDQTLDQMSQTTAMAHLWMRQGQTYLYADTAWEYISPFAPEVTTALVREHYELAPDDEADIEHGDRLLALSSAFADELVEARDARGIVNALPHERILCYAEVTGLLADAIGAERSDTTMAGSGFTMDARHDENVEVVIETVDGLSTAAISTEIDRIEAEQDGA